MKIVPFGVYEARIDESKELLSIWNVGADGGCLVRIELKGLSVLTNNSHELVFRKGWFTYGFYFSEFTPGLEKVKYLSKLFHKIPFFRFNGEVGAKYKSELRSAIEKYS